MTANPPFIIDAREACSSQRTGKGQWAYGFISELLRRSIPVVLFTDGDAPPEWRQPHCRVEVIAQRGIRWHLAALRLLRSLYADGLYVSPTSFIVPAFAPRSIRCVPIVHDLIAFRHERHQLRATVIERWTLPRALHRAERVCTISDATKRDLLRRFSWLAPERLTAIFAGPAHPHPQQHAEASARDIVCIATLCPRKNQMRLMEAYARLPQRLRNAHRLVLAGGRGWQDAAIVRAARSIPGVEWVGYVDGARYEQLLSTCAIFALPSLYEGFGMQILDALQRGVPVLTSDRGSLRELAEGAAQIVDPEDISSISSGLERLLTDGALRTDLRQKALVRAAVFSWKRTVDLFLGAVQR